MILNFKIVLANFEILTQNGDLNDVLWSGCGNVILQHTFVSAHVTGCRIFHGEGRLLRDTALVVIVG